MLSALDLNTQNLLCSFVVDAPCISSETQSSLKIFSFVIPSQKMCFVITFKLEISYLYIYIYIEREREGLISFEWWNYLMFLWFIGMHRGILLWGWISWKIYFWSFYISVECIDAHHCSSLLHIILCLFYSPYQPSFCHPYPNCHRFVYI